MLIGFFVLCIASRVASGVLGLVLAVACAAGAFEIMTDPKDGDVGLGLLFLPWMGLGIFLAADGLKRK